MPRAMFAPPDPHPSLQAVQAIEAGDPLPIHAPACTPQQHPDPLLAEPRAGVSQITDAELPRGLILGLTFSIPRRPAELG